MKPPLAAVVSDYPIPFLQRLRASFLPRAFPAFDPGHGSCGGASAEVFGERATLALTACQANELITTDSVEPIIRHRPFVRLTSLGEGRSLDGQIATMSSASEQADSALKELVALYDDAKLRSMIDGVVAKSWSAPARWCARASQ